MSTPGPATSRACAHSQLVHVPSQHAAKTAFRLKSAKELQDAARLPVKGTAKEDTALEIPPGFHGHSWSFPAPLVLPNDDLAEDPEYPPQSAEECQKNLYRKAPNNRRRTIYLCAPPALSDDGDFMSAWREPSLEHWETPTDGHSPQVTATPRPNIEHVVEYISAFYHGLPVKVLNDTLKFMPWTASPPKSKQKGFIPSRVGLKTGKAIFGIRARGPSPDGHFPAQLNLNDLLDVAISILPPDAYAVLMLVDHDIYESDDDDFCCGRAYGGSRVAVVSSARYHPSLDRHEGVDREHAWPASHCVAYHTSLCAAAGTARRPRKKARLKAPASKRGQSEPKGAPTPLRAAVLSHRESSRKVAVDDPSALAGLWMGRVCKTASHELGHCVGVDHCVYYACIMQGTSCLAEDARQPPYCCPVDQVKVLAATGASVEAQYKALKGFCDKYSDIDLFRAYGAWLGAMLEPDTLIEHQSE